MNIVEPIRSKELLNQFRQELKERNCRDYVIAEIGFLTGLKELGFNILNEPDRAEGLAITNDKDSMMYNFRYKGVRYQAEYLKNIK